MERWYIERREMKGEIKGNGWRKKTEENRKQSVEEAGDR